MSNRRKSAQERTTQMYRNASSQGRSGWAIRERWARGGDWKRGEGKNNIPYGPLLGQSRVSINTLHRRAARPRRTYGTEADYAEMNRDQLRVAAKNLGVEGWHKMNKAQLLAAVTA